MGCVYENRVKVHSILSSQVRVRHESDNPAYNLLVAFVLGITCHLHSIFMYKFVNTVNPFVALESLHFFFHASASMNE